MAGFFSDEILSEVISANDIVDICSGYVRLKRSGSGFMGCCPFHKEKTPSFHVSPDKQLYHCFGCGAGGSVIQFIMNAEGLDFQDAVRFLADRAGIALPEDGTNPNEERHLRKKRIYEMNRDAARFFRECLLSPSSENAREYLTNRALTGKTISSFGLGYSPGGWDNLLKHLLKKGYEKGLIVESGLCIQNDKGHVYDRFRQRIMYPIIDVRNNIIGFGGRILTGDGAKYMNSPESIVYDKGKNLFALNLAKKSKRGYFILVEGYMDVISLHQAGIDCAVAGCGTALTRDQARLISKSPVYLCYDTDEAGTKACERAADIFKEFGTKLRVIRIPRCKDADEFIKKCGVSEFEKCIKNAKSVTTHRIDMLLKDTDLNDPNEKIEFLTKCAKILSELSNSVEREVHINELSLKTSISVESINSEIRKINGRNVKKELNAELRKTVNRNNTLPSQEKKGRRSVAEEGFLSALCESRKIFEAYKDRFSVEDFSTDIHKEIFEKIFEFYEKENSGECSEFLLSSLKGKEKDVSAVCMLMTNVEDPRGAAEDFKNVLEDEIFNEKLQEAQKSGDVRLINELLKKKRNTGR